jgi:hypothetical protein
MVGLDEDELIMALFVARRQFLRQLVYPSSGRAKTSKRRS